MRYVELIVNLMAFQLSQPCVRWWWFSYEARKSHEDLSRTQFVHRGTFHIHYGLADMFSHYELLHFYGRSSCCRTPIWSKYDSFQFDAIFLVDAIVSVRSTEDLIENSERRETWTVGSSRLMNIWHWAPKCLTIFSRNWRKFTNKHGNPSKTSYTHRHVFPLPFLQNKVESGTATYTCMHLRQLVQNK